MEEEKKNCTISEKEKSIATVTSARDTFGQSQFPMILWKWEKKKGKEKLWIENGIEDKDRSRGRELASAPHPNVDHDELVSEVLEERHTTVTEDRSSLNTSKEAPVPSHRYAYSRPDGLTQDFCEAEIVESVMQQTNRTNEVGCYLNGRKERHPTRKNGILNTENKNYKDNIKTLPIKMYST